MSFLFLALKCLLALFFGHGVQLGGEFSISADRPAGDMKGHSESILSFNPGAILSLLSVFESGLFLFLKVVKFAA